MGERLKKQLFWFSLIIGIAALLGSISLLYLIYLAGVDLTYLFMMLLFGYPIYLCLTAYRYRGKVDQELALSPLPFQIYFWLMVLDHALSFVTGDFSGKALAVGMTIWTYHIIKQIKAYNANLPQV